MLTMLTPRTVGEFTGGLRPSSLAQLAVLVDPRADKEVAKAASSLAQLKILTAASAELVNIFKEFHSFKSEG